MVIIMKKSWISRLDEIIFAEITPGPIDTFIVQVFGLIVLGFQKALRSISGWEKETGKVFVVDIRNQKVRGLSRD